MCTTQKKLLLVVSEKISDAQHAQMSATQTAKVSGHLLTVFVRLILRLGQSTSTFYRFEHLVNNNVNYLTIKHSFVLKPVGKPPVVVQNCDSQAKIEAVMHGFNTLTTITRISLKESH